ncbi:hypothetical protein GQ43DRAFT_430919 [Delitschia confertaspora ATCC 74209]|uniref:Uncharacterized protein n=1 Tax=Delitschia confertaspora ATCC 74209 TaxID=1513339 RepID=A0A9P4JND8_9PLEO|nr:hypothetical protein GQ43DRAFT_430919 [Delitschia confertaspora ATCC 74209]
MYLQPPWALFVTSKDINAKYINDALTRAWKGDNEGAWNLWLATDSYTDIPKLRDDNEIAEGTKPPIPDNFASPFAGKSVEECAKWLQHIPGDSAVNKEYFTVINEFSKEDDTVLVVQVNKNGEGGEEIEVEYFPQPTKNIMMEMWTNGRGKFEEKASNYQRARFDDGKPDRSKGPRYG